MAKITYVKAAQKRKPGKPDRVCGKCGDKIEIGQSYRWWAFRYGGKRVRCVKPACKPTQADLETNEFRRRLLEIEEGVEKEIALICAAGPDVDGVAGVLEYAAQELRDHGEEQRSKLEGMPDGLQQGETGLLLAPVRAGFEKLADELDELAQEIRSMTREEPEKGEEEESDDDFAQRILDEVSGRIDLGVD